MAKEKRSIIIEVIALILSLIALLTGWLVYGGFIFGVLAVILGTIYYRKNKNVVSLLSIIFGCIGIAEAIATGLIVISIIEMSNKTIEAINESLSLKEVQISSLPYTFQIGEGKKLQLSDIEIKKVDYVTKNISFLVPSFRVYFPREGFVFYIVKYTLKNVGSKKIDGFDLLNSFELITDNGVYEPLDFYEMAEERGWKSFETNDIKYTNNICERFGKFFDNIYPNETIISCIFFEIRENEKPKGLRFMVGLSLTKYLYGINEI